MYQSIPSLTIPPQAYPQGIFWKGEFPTPRHKEIAKPRPLGQIIRAETPPLGQLFSNIQQKNMKHETEIMKNSTEMQINLEILKQWNI